MEKTLIHKNDLVIIKIKDGSLQLFYGNINKENPDLHIIDDIQMYSGNQYILIKARQLKSVRITGNFKEGEEREVLKEMVTYERFINISRDGDKIVQKYHKHTRWMKLLGKPAINFNYIHLGSGHDGTYGDDRGREIVLNTQHWDNKQYEATSFIITKL